MSADSIATSLSKASLNDPAEEVGDKTPALGHNVESKVATAVTSGAATGAGAGGQQLTIEEDAEEEADLLAAQADMAKALHRQLGMEDLLPSLKNGGADTSASRKAKLLEIAAAMGMHAANTKGSSAASVAAAGHAAIAAAAEKAAAGASSSSSSSTTTSLLPPPPSTIESAQSLLAKQHKFWSTQPVPKLGEAVIDENGPLETKTVAEVRVEPYSLPAGFEWVTIDVTDAQQMQEMYQLLAAHYVEDDDNMFRFAYSSAFLSWALTPPGFYKEWHVGVRVASTKKLVGCITGVPADMSMYAKRVKLCEINFLCVDKKLRSKRLAPVLIKEVTRRVNLTGIWQAAYTAGVVLPKPVASCQYWHRSINPKKLIEIRFAALPANMTMQRMERLYKLPQTPQTPGFRPMVANDVPAACAGLRSYLLKFGLHPELNEADFSHWLLPREHVIDSYVVDAVEDVENGRGKSSIVAMVSFYHLPSTVIGHAKHKDMFAGYLYYYFTTPGVGPTLERLVEDALVAARLKGVDVFNCLDLANNSEFLTNLKFAQGDGNLQYYLYNWACPSMPPKDVGLVML